jgi:hypothetical protein
LVTSNRLSDAAILLILVLTPIPLNSLSMSANSSSNAQGTVSIWSKITLERASAYSWTNQRPPEDCMHPKHVECFSIQQNLWIFDSNGEPVLWTQNAVELAKVEGKAYLGTFAFQVWSPAQISRPVLCEPESFNNTDCRAPFYTDPISFPQSFEFYSHISNLGPDSVLHMSSNFGAIDWKIPASVDCPCLGTVLGKQLPWGSPHLSW